MEREFYRPVERELAVPEENRHWLTGDNVDEIRALIAAAPIRLTYGGWGGCCAGRSERAAGASGER